MPLKELKPHPKKVDAYPDRIRVLDDDLRPVGQMLKNRRREIGYTQKQIAQYMGCSVRLISEIENGTRNVSFATLARYACGIGLDFYLEKR